MKKLILLCLILFLGYQLTFCQNVGRAPYYSISNYKGKTYIFDQNQTITESNAVGRNKGAPITAYKGTRFTIEHVDSLTGEVTIKFLPFKVNRSKDALDTTQSIKTAINNRMRYNFKRDPIKEPSTGDTFGDNVRYFTITDDQTRSSVSRYAAADTSRWTVSLGTLTNPFKLRPSKRVFTTNLTLGTAIFAQYRLNEDWAGGGVIGLSLSSVTLDSASTTGFVHTTTERPAITPSISALVSYKNINITLGIGIDYINKVSVIEKSWVFNGKPWIGFGIGISLFNGSVSTNGTVPIVGQ